MKTKKENIIFIIVATLFFVAIELTKLKIESKTNVDVKLIKFYIDFYNYIQIFIISTIAYTVTEIMQRDRCD